MKRVIDPAGTDAVILCGGKGERLKSVVGDVPKPMADINGRPFLDILMDYLSNFGFRRIILCSGYKGEEIKRYYGKKSRSLDILCSHEEEPLGTAGAIKNAQALIKSNPFLVMNGDSFCPADLREFMKFYDRKGADFAMVLAAEAGGGDSGAVELDGSQRITIFIEKATRNKSGLANAGIYLLGKKVLDLIETGRKISLEYDIFPKILDKKFYGYATKERFIDIGTPERYSKAKESLKNGR